MLENEVKGKAIRLIRFDPSTWKRFHFIRRVFRIAAPDADPNGLKVSGEENKTNIEQNYQDEDAVVVEEYDVAAIQADLEADTIKQAGMGTVPELPAVLLSVEVTYNISNGNGASNYPASQAQVVITTSGSGSISPKASAESSAAILPSISWDIADHYRRMIVDHTDVSFWMPRNATKAEVLAKLTEIMGDSVTAFPKFKVKSHQIKLFGEQKSIQQRATTEAGLSSQGTSATSFVQWGDDSGSNSAGSEKTETIPETIHGAITITGTTPTTQALSTSIQANTSALYFPGGGIAVGAITNQPTGLSTTVTGSFSPETLAATSPSSIPNSGLILTALSVSNQAVAERVQHVARVVDFTQYA